MKKLAIHFKILIGMILIVFMSNCKESLKYKCDVCDMYFEEKEWAEKCQDWCENHYSCNAEITQHAITNPNK
ncbi:MAG: hypothetical protein VYD33_04780 [Bacteroidota bacterium]|nr:hypothetical protein [Bacteroidota bacterium]